MPFNGVLGHDAQTQTHNPQNIYWCISTFVIFCIFASICIYVRCKCVCFGLRLSSNTYELEEAREQIAMLEVG